MRVLIATGAHNVEDQMSVCAFLEMKGHTVRTGTLQLLSNLSTAHERFKENIAWMDCFLIVMPSGNVADEECCFAFNSEKKIILFHPALNEDIPNPYPGQVSIVTDINVLLKLIEET